MNASFCIIPATDLDTMMEHTKYFVLLSQVHLKQDEIEDSVLNLTSAKDMQARSLLVQLCRERIVLC